MEPGLESASDLTPRIGKVARRELALNGYTRYEQVASVTPGTLLRIHGVGPKAVRILAEELAARRMAFAEDGEEARPG